MKNIAVLGLGKMGSGIARSLLRAGFAVRVWNRTKEKAGALLQYGAIWAESPSAAAMDADAVISMLADDLASHEVWMGENGGIYGLKKGAFMIECSTVSLEQVERLAGEAKKRGLHYIDCPVTGWPEHAAAGQLTLLVGADQVDFEKVQGLLNAFAKAIILFGGPGKGTAYKLTINLMGAVQIAGLAEAISMAEKLGLDKEQVIKAIETSVAASPQVIKNARPMAERFFEADPHFSVGLRRKDTVYAIELARKYKARVPLGETALDWFEAAAQKGSGLDQAVVIEVIAGN
jgi:3-hydroxyisobutyrate dehydrogenase